MVHAAGAAGVGRPHRQLVATLRGTENPELVYVVSSHFDSVAAGPGADDDTSGTAALLEAARILAPNPLPVTVVFASFTGEEAGLLGSREFVRLAGEEKWNIVGALNNDMIGWGGEGSRMDNTIRYSNAGIRDIQHGAAFLFSKLVLYDAKYYRGTDAAAFYEGWGDIVGGIGSYPVLANPELSPAHRLSRDDEPPADRGDGEGHGGDARVPRVEPVAAQGRHGGEDGGGCGSHVDAQPGIGHQDLHRRLRAGQRAAARADDGDGARAVLPAGLPAGTQIAVKAVNGRGLEGWDWARTVLQ